MKKLSLLLLSIIIIGLIYTPSLFGQSSGDFRSAQTGIWRNLTTWQTYNGSTWVAATNIPDSTSPAAVTILSPHNVTVDTTIGVRNVTVNAGATITVNGIPVILYITQEGMTVNGTLTLTGNVSQVSPFCSVVSVTTNPLPGTLTIGNGGVVNYDQGAAVTGTKGALPTATWLTGSTLNVDSAGAAGASGWSTGTAQDFYNINWNCAHQTATFGWGFNGNTIGGRVAILNTNTGRIQFFGGNSGTLNILGDFIVSGSASATINGTSSTTNDTINIYGKVNVNTTGNFSVSRGSQGGAGTSIFNFYGDSVKIIAGSMNNSHASPDTMAKFVFKKNGTQYLTLTPTTISGNALPIEVDAGATVVLTSTVNATTLYLNGGIIVSSAANPLFMGWWTGTSLTSGAVSVTYPGSATSYVSGPMAYLYATAAGSTTKTYPIGKGGKYRPISLSFTQTDATLSTYTAEMFNSAPAVNTLPGTLDKVSTMRYYTISEGVGGSAFTAGSILLNYDTDDGVTDFANLRIAQGPSAGGGTWVDLGGTGTANNNGSITSVVPFTSFSNFVLANHTGGTNPVPVELSSFTANNNGRTTQLNWITKTEVNFNKFVIDRALVNTKDATVAWAPVGTVQASGTSSSQNKYSFSEKNLQAGKYQYRLKMIDYDGSFKYSNVVEIKVALPKDFSISQNYPNPFNPSTKIDYQVPVDAKVIMEVYNIAGQKVSELVNQDQSAGYYTVDFGASKLSSGVYIYRIVASDKATGNNFSSIKKMMLLK
jgi:hypothetical protein